LNSTVRPNGKVIIATWPACMAPIRSFWLIAMTVFGKWPSA